MTSKEEEGMEKVFMERSESKGIVESMVKKEIKLEYDLSRKGKEL